ncbi:MAG: 50S ribosomal protein L31e [Candidatus Aenigmarchaeota archaeon]|nr:50S ribosomal protein L31e [Candidatus Aenigmarchaeota archaeon]
MAEKSKTGKEGGTKTGGEEKVMVIPLRRKSRKSPRNMRMNRCVKEIRAFLSRHMKTEPSNVRISQQLNEFLWKGGVHNPPSRIKIKVSTGEEGKVFASLLEEKERTKKEKKAKLGLRERLARRKEGAKEEEKADVKEKPTEKPETKKEKPPKKEPAPEEIEKELMLEG